MLLSLVAGYIARDAEMDNALEIAKDAVRQGDMDGDNSLNAFEFEREVNKNPKFADAVYTALDENEDGIMVRH